MSNDSFGFINLFLMRYAFGGQVTMQLKSLCMF